MSGRALKAIGLAVLVSLAPACSFSSSRVERGVITDFGILEVVGGLPDRQADGTTAGHQHLAKQMKLVRSTDRITGTRGITFGYMFIVEGSPKGAIVNATVTIHHPPIQAPGAASPSEEESWAQQLQIGYPSGAAFRFDEPWEIVRGNWTIKVASGPWVLAEKRFVVE